MVDETLVGYIKDGLRRGYNIDALRQALISEGWDMNQVNEAINFVQTPSMGVPHQLPAKPAQQVPSAPKTPSKTPSRPTGITVICVLGILGSIFLLISGIIAVFFAGLLGGLSMDTGMGSPLTFSTEEIAFLIMVFAFANIAIGVISLAGYYLLLKMKRTGWLIVTIMGVVVIAISALNFITDFSFDSLLTIILWTVIIAYIFTKRKLFV